MVTFTRPAAKPEELPPKLAAFANKFLATVSSLSSELKLIEGRLDTFSSRVDIVDTSSVERHKATTSRLRTLEARTRSLRADLDELESLLTRIEKRLEALATKDEVKVLERYTELWQPLNFVTKSEAASIVRNILKEQKTINE